MFHIKRYLQFNNLVFDGYDMISQSDESGSFKITTQSYSYGHGSFAPLKADYMFAAEGSVTMTIALHTKKVPCEYREYYVRFAEQELMRPGKLWAIKNNEILWAYAIPKNVHQIRTPAIHYAEYDIEFVIPEGIWHKADKQRTFLVPYNVCVFMECKGYKTLNPCQGFVEGDCCTVCEENKHQKDMEERCFCCCADQLTEDMMLCYHLKDIQKFYSCDTPYQLVYDCLHAEKFNPNEHIGQKMCVKDMCDSSIIAGRFYSETDIPTKDFTLIIEGSMHNPSIDINGNTNIIKGDYEGTLRIEASGDVYYQKDKCCEPELLSPSVWEKPSDMDYGWTIYPQNNSIIVNLNRCCNGMTCIYIDIDNITL